VHDDDDTKGGCFRSRGAALRFVADEFGADAETVVQPRFPTASSRAISHFNAARSVAHRAAAAR
jgi:hypothetical protein